MVTLSLCAIPYTTPSLFFFCGIWELSRYFAEFFLDASWVEARLLERGSLELDKERCFDNRELHTPPIPHEDI